MSQSKSTAPPITNVRYYRNTTEKGNPTATKVKRGVFYYTYGTREQNPDLLPRGEWYSRHGAERYGDVAAWAEGKAVQQTYTYSMVLSLRDGLMRPEDFTRAMEESGEDIFDDWRLIAHYDTEHDHAHVLAFRHKTLSRKEFNRWRQKAGQVLEEAEQRRLREAEQAADLGRKEHVRRRQRGLGMAFDDDLAFEI